MGCDDCPYGFDPDQTEKPRHNESGWGLFLFERLSHRWGVAQDGRSTRVWFEVEC